jgi:hypothetical protein
MAHLLHLGHILSSEHAVATSHFPMLLHFLPHRFQSFGDGIYG